MYFAHRECAPKLQAPNARAKIGTQTRLPEGGGW